MICHIFSILYTITTHTATFYSRLNLSQYFNTWVNTKFIIPTFIHIIHFSNLNSCLHNHPCQRKVTLQKAAQYLYPIPSDLFLYNNNIGELPPLLYNSNFGELSPLLYNNNFGELSLLSYNSIFGDLSLLLKKIWDDVRIVFVLDKMNFIIVGFF